MKKINKTKAIAELELQNKIMSLFLNSQDLDAMFEEAISILGNYLDCDRVYFCLYRFRRGYYELYKQWSKSHKHIETGENNSNPPSPIEFHEAFKKKKIITIKDIRKSSCPDYLSYLENNKIKSLICFPLFDESIYLGFIGVESKKENINILSHKHLITSAMGLIGKQATQYRIRQELSDSENKYRSLFNSVSAEFTNYEMVYDKDSKPIDFRFLEANKTFLDNHGLTASECIGKMARSIFPNVEDTLLHHVIKALESGEPVEYEGYSEILNNYYHFFIFKSGENTFAILAYDITDKKISENSVIESEQKYRNLFESMQAGFANHEMIYDNNKAVDYRFIEINEKFKEITGMKNETWVGKTLKEIIPDVEDAWIKDYDGIIKTGKPIEINRFEPALNRYYNVIAYKTGEHMFATLATDITHLKQMEVSLFEEKERLKTTLESIAEGVVATDVNGNITLINEVAETMTGWTKEEAEGITVNKVVEIYDLASNHPANNTVYEAMSTSQSVSSTRYVRLINKKTHAKYIISDISSPIQDKEGNILGAILVFRDVTEDKKRMDEIQFLSIHDSLTGLFNRAYFEEKLQEFNKNKDYPFSVIMGDANGLKITNDVFGHSEGDNLLRQISQILTDNSGPSDIVARWGGDEFVILLPGANSSAAEAVCDKITDACSKIEENLDGYSACPSISLGYETCLKHERNILKIVKSAEDWMYKKKLLESKSAHSAIIESMKKTLFEKSHETEQHAERLSSLCCALAKQLDLSSQEVYDMELFSLLHDIGKVAIDGSILTKEGKLTEDEWKEIRKHPEIGYRIANSAPELSQVAEFILSHHERWDGKGYPHGLSGEKIPIQSRILALVDTYDAITHDRPYRKAKSKSYAIDEIKTNSGKQFDPKIVEVFVNDVLK